MFTPQAVWAHEFLAGRKDPPQSMRWWPAESYVSCDGRTAINTGPWATAERQVERLLHHRVAARAQGLALGL